ncbi:Hexose carrier protein hex6 [Asimina triloba]
MGAQGQGPPQDVLNIYNYSGKMTAYVLGSCMVAATGGFIFGYDMGVSGGVTSMDSFLEEFFPDVYRNMHKPEYNRSLYCKFDSQLLTAFSSLLYVAGLFSSFVAARTTRDYGRKKSMFIGSIAFLLGSVISGAAVNLIMLLAGRLLLGAGVGFAAQVIDSKSHHSQLFLHLQVAGNNTENID